MDDVKDRVRALLAQYTNGVLPPDDGDVRDFGLDSVGALEFFAELESAFGVRFEGDELDLQYLNSVEAIAALLQRKRRR